MAVTEACSNALRHGHGEAAPRLTWFIDGERVRFCVEDFSGQRWSRTAHPSRDLADYSPRAEDRIGGFGLDLMHGLMDEVDIKSGCHGTVVELSKALFP